MILNHQNVSDFFKTQSTIFKNAFADNVSKQWMRIATEVNSTNESTDFGWLGEAPDMRQWLGAKIVKRLAAHSYSIVNDNWELTVGVDKHRLQDDNFGIYSTFTNAIARSAGHWVGKDLVFQALQDGISTNCYDGQFFFDTDHPMAGSTFSNLQSGGGGNGYWYLLDTKHMIKPIIYLNRLAPQFFSVVSMSDTQVFLTGEFLYGVEARGAAGYGLWQTAYADNRALSLDNFRADRLAMRGITNDEGRELGIDPDVIVVGRANQDIAEDLFGLSDTTDRGTNTTSINPVRRAVEVLVVPWLP